MNSSGEIYEILYFYVGGVIAISAFVMLILILIIGKIISNKNRPLFFILFFVALHIVIRLHTSFYDTITVEGAPLLLCYIPFYIANWPSVLLGIYPIHEFNGQVEKYLDSSYLNPLIVLTNILGWATLGALLGFLTSLILKWRKK
jgi:hypothetical protein